jgi:dihydrodipicolinate synthase/N-acetylneuraminate lyase
MFHLGTNLTCRAATTFTTRGEFDEEAYRLFLQRFIENNIGIYLASGGSGEGCSMTLPEFHRVCQVGAETCKGKIMVGANQPETHTPRAALEYARLGIDAGMDIINIFGPAAWHGYKATDAEYFNYFDRILTEVKHPVALCPNPTLGYPISPVVVASLCNKFPQVSALNLSGIYSGTKGDMFFITLMDRLDREVPIYVTFPGSVNLLDMGAAGIVPAQANIIPKTFRRYMDLYQAAKPSELARVYADMQRVTDFLSPWNSAGPRWIKMWLRVFKQPGGDGGLREPYLMPDDAELTRFAEGALSLDVPEVQEQARAAGLG